LAIVVGLVPRGKGQPCPLGIVSPPRCSRPIGLESGGRPRGLVLGDRERFRTAGESNSDSRGRHEKSNQTGAVVT